MSPYRVVITLSHRTIAFEYNQNGADGLLLPFPETSNPEALSFYCEADRVVVGNGGRVAFEAGKSGAFSDYFELIKQGQTFKYAGADLSHQYLLLHALEDRFRVFFRSILINKGTLDDNRSTMPLLFVLENDIQPNERRVVEDLFRNAGYGCMAFTPADDYVQRLAAGRRPGQRVLSAWSDGTDLILSLMFPDGSRKMLSLPGLGTDPRIRHVVEKLYDDLKSELWTTLEDEQEYLTRVGREFIMSKAPELDGTVILSDGMEHSIYLSKIWLNSIPMPESDRLQRALASFLEENGCTDRTPVVLLLRGALTGNDYFKQQLSNGFGEVVEIDDALQAQLNKLMVTQPITPSEISTTPPPPPPPPPPVEEVKYWLARAEKAFLNGQNEQGDTFINKADRLMRDLKGEYPELKELRARAFSHRKDKPKPPEPPRPARLTGDEIARVKQLLREAKGKFVSRDNAAGDRLVAQADRMMAGRADDATLLSIRANTLSKRVAETPQPKPAPRSASKPASSRSATQKPSMMETQQLHPQGVKIKAQDLGPAQRPLHPGMPEAMPGAVPSGITPLPPQARKKAAPSVKISNPEALAFMKAGQYTKAKTVFMNEGNSEMASACSQLNRASKNAKVAEAQLASPLTAAKKAEYQKTVAQYQALRKKFGLDK